MSSQEDTQEKPQADPRAEPQAEPQTAPTESNASVPSGDVVWVRISPSQVVRAVLVALLTAAVVLGAFFLLWQVRTFVGWFVIALQRVGCALQRRGAYRPQRTDGAGESNLDLDSLGLTGWLSRWGQGRPRWISQVITLGTSTPAYRAGSGRQR